MKPQFAYARNQNGGQTRVPTWEDYAALLKRVEELEKKNDN